ncbi:ABC transporter permease [Streptomyces violarus]|uniref:Multiple sugar transport system permease protein n=1 Tax=Streptomyces violarus TaxID=67380 RepID=A0A7W4ZMJ6_9ACTN|nr:MULTISPECIES: ABC transporter permease subunit [Streptomyces]MBB3075238.1 multiple sugar transport system permease protein [Streptomyces violarus]WRT97862.1 ABC transporter permease subunit [Streptomyces sp. CGMCC 4.1772]GHD02866.1 ABC transporter permease [Streptomyces violarus]
MTQPTVRKAPVPAPPGVGARRPGAASPSSRPPGPLRRALRFVTPGPSADAGGAALHRRWWLPWLWMAPAIIGATVFGVFPFLNTLVVSFTDAKPLGGAYNLVGLDNYRRMLGDPDFWLATRNSLLYALFVVPLMVLLPLLLAILVEKNLPGIGFFRSAFYTPVLASSVVVGLSWQWLLSDQGLVNTWLQKAHLIREAVPFLSDSWLILLSAMGLTLWKGLGWYMIFYLAALGNVPKELHEAAAVDGAGAVRRFWHVTVPGVRQSMMLVGTLTGIGSLRVFTEIYMLGGSTGGPGGADRTLPFYIRDVGLDPLTGNAGYGAAVSVALFALTLGLTLLAQRLTKEEEA